jgi:hypothetical protein
MSEASKTEEITTHMFEDASDHIATPSEACKEYARNYGSDHLNQAWILTNWDTWERNPFYSGPPQPHPEDDCPNPPDLRAEDMRTLSLMEKI